MPTATDQGSLLARIADLATRAATRPDVPATLKSVLAEIAALAQGGTTGDTPEPSDVSSTDNQSL